MFDIDSTIEIAVRTASGKVPITIRWPSDDEWTTHRKKRKIVMRQFGRGISETDIESGDADLKLYQAITVNGNASLTIGEAGKIIEVISQCDVIGVDLGASEADVQLQILTGEVKHVLKVPTMDQVRELQRSTRIISLPYNRQEIRTNLDGAARLWDKCVSRTEGYQSSIPNIHKDVAIRAVINAIEQEVTAKYDEGNF
jgi:hypothetical protein